MTKEKLLAMPADDYMNAEQHAFFTELLQSMKVEIHERIEKSRVAIESLDTPADPADAASVEEERHWLVNTIDRDQRLLPQLEIALGRIKDDSFGWCEDSGEPIGLKRLLISPTTKYCIEAPRADRQAPASGLTPAVVPASPGFTARGFCVSLPCIKQEGLTSNEAWIMAL